MQGDDDPVEIQPGERARMSLAVEGLLRMLRIVQDAFPDDDLETIVVLLTAIAGGMALNSRDPETLRSLDAAPLPDDLFRSISGRAVAASCGLPRETVRRRLEHLTAQGRMIHDDRGYRPAPGTMLTAQTLTFARLLVREFEGGPARLARLDPPAG